MVGYYERRWSFAARWCERLALVCLPYFAISILLHRFGQITAPQAYWLIGFGVLMILGSLALGVRAFFDLWYSGMRGGKATIRGLLLSIVLLGPFLWFGYQTIVNPLVNDVATNPFSPPPFINAQALRLELRDENINQLADYDATYAELLLSAYPDIGSRRYNAGVPRIYDAVRQLVADRRWKVTATRGVPQTAGSAGQADSGNADTPALPPQSIEIEVVASSLIYGFKRDIVIQIVAETETTLVDMRSSTRWGQHDFGMDARVIRAFLADLDQSLLGIAGEG